ncbi:Caspase domain containing protein [Lactarius tabidus]
MLLEYIAEEAPPDCDMVLVHDYDLARRLYDIYHDATPIDNLQPDVVLNQVKKREPTIYKAQIAMSSVHNSTCDDSGSAWVATLSNIFEKQSPSSTPSTPQSPHVKTPSPRREHFARVGHDLLERPINAPHSRTLPAFRMPSAFSSPFQFDLPLNINATGTPPPQITHPLQPQPYRRRRRSESYEDGDARGNTATRSVYEFVNHEYHSPWNRQKKALLVGISYSRHQDASFRHKWGVHDAYETTRFLQGCIGFHHDNMRILTENEYVNSNSPTKANILAAMRWLVMGARPGDKLFFYFSGHATRVPVDGTNGGEQDGFDEGMCAMDYEGENPPTGIIFDDEIHDIMVKPLPEGCCLTVILDCCQSGAILDLPFIYDSHGVLKPTKPDTVRLRPSADVISLSTCKVNGRDFETRGGGALRKVLIEYMKASENHVTYLDIIRSLRTYMNAKGIRQRVQLSSSHIIDMDQQFCLFPNRFTELPLRQQLDDPASICSRDPVDTGHESDDIPMDRQDTGYESDDLPKRQFLPQRAGVPQSPPVSVHMMRFGQAGPSHGLASLPNVK